MRASINGFSKINSLWRVGYGTAAAVAGLAGIIINSIGQSGIGNAPALNGNGVWETRELGHKLFTEYVIPFEIVSLLLLVAMVGCILLSKRDESKKEETQ